MTYEVASVGNKFVHSGYDIESDILLKYKDGAILDLQDNSFVIRNLKSIGLLRCGFDLEENKETVRTTARGLGLLAIRGII